tara:strand:- start:288 stop:404 length:117 start_codon:yes stop_codon:yes gene_type:complete
VNKNIKIAVKAMTAIALTFFPYASTQMSGDTVELFQEK